MNTHPFIHIYPLSRNPESALSLIQTKASICLFFHFTISSSHPKWLDQIQPNLLSNLLTEVGGSKRTFILPQKFHRILHMKTRCAYISPACYGRMILLEFWPFDKSCIWSSHDMRFPTMWYVIIIYGYILLFFYFCFRFSQKMKTKDPSKSYVKIHKANKYVFTLCILVTHPMVF